MGIINTELVVTITGYESGNPDELVHHTIEIETKELFKIVDELINCINAEFVPEIENTANPFHGWRVMGVEIMHPDLDKAMEKEGILSKQGSVIIPGTRVESAENE